MRSRLTAVSLLVLGAARAVLSSPCIAFDADFNLLAFGLGGKDWNAGPQDSWKSGSAASDVTASGRPSFDGTGTTCYLSQFLNVIYVLNGDSSNNAAVYIYDAAAKSWSTQSTTPGSYDPTSSTSILDHDTNVFYALSKGELFYLDMGGLKSANSSALPWIDVQAAPFAPGYNQPVMALAQNHIYFLNVPSIPAGQAEIFVIHYSWFQPEPQMYPAQGANTFPFEHGQATSFFQTTGVQQEFAFIPDDGKFTYVINVENNSTTPLAGPVTQDPNAQYFGGITSLVQLTSSGAVNYIPYTQGDASANGAADWSPVAPLVAAAPASAAPSGTASSGGGGSSSKTATSKGPSGTGSAAPGATSSSDARSVARGIAGALVGALVVGIGAVLL